MAWIPAAIGAVAAIGSSLLGSSASRSAANKAAQSQRDALAAKNALFEKQSGFLKPYRDFGEGALNNLTSLQSSSGRNRFLEDYFKSSEYSTLSTAARGNIANSSEASGISGGSYQNNLLGRIAPNLGLNALNQRIGLLQNEVGIGEGAATGTGNFANTLSNNIGSTYDNLTNIGIQRDTASAGYVTDLLNNKEFIGNISSLFTPDDSDKKT